MTGEENLLSQSDARLRQTIAQQFEEIIPSRSAVAIVVISEADRARPLGAERRIPVVGRDHP